MNIRDPPMSDVILVIKPLAAVKLGPSSNPKYFWTASNVVLVAT